MNIGDNIKKYRKEIKITQQQLADKIEKSINTVKKYESGYTSPPLPVIKDIAEALMVSTTDLIPISEKNSGNLDKRNSIIYELGLLKGMVNNEDQRRKIDHIYKLYRDRTSLDMLKELIESLNYDYDVKNIDTDTLDNILKKVSDVIELELYKLNK